MKYNLINFNTSLVDFNKFIRIRVFDKDFNVKSQKDVLHSELKFILYFSYRSDFYPIDSQDYLWTTDCGWGCMIRASQMMLSRAVFKIKLAESIQIEELKEEYYYEGSRKLKVAFNTLLMFVETKEEVSVDNYINFPNFSISNICREGNSFGKGAGDWFSDVNMVNIFCKINKETQSISNTEILTFNDNLIEEEEILRTCFKEYNCECLENNIKCECLKIKDKTYMMTTKGVIFVSCRVGLDNIDPQYYIPITRLFSIKNNIGLIGGKGHYALYFIGVTDDHHLIYLDPHFKQTSLTNISELYLPDAQQTFFNKKFYFLDFKNASPAFTFGVYFSSVKEFKQIQYSLKLYSKTENAIFKYKGLDNTIEENSEEVNKEEKLEYNCEDVDDFCVISK